MRTQLRVLVRKSWARQCIITNNTRNNIYKIGSYRQLHIRHEAPSLFRRYLVTVFFSFVYNYLQSYSPLPSYTTIFIQSARRSSPFS